METAKPPGENKGLSGYLSDLLGLCVDTTDKTVTSGLPVKTLRHMRVTPENLIEKHGINTLDFIMKNTKYSPEDLVEWGFTHELFLKAGLSPRHCALELPRAFFDCTVGSLANLIEIFSKNRMALASHGFNTKVLLWLGGDAPALAKAGFKAEHLIAMDFSLKEWQEEMGLTAELMRGPFAFTYNSCFEFIQQDPACWPEFEQRFGFLPKSPISSQPKTAPRERERPNNEAADGFFRPIRVVNGKPVG